MSNSVSKKLALVKEIINEGAIEDALQLVKDVEQMKNLTPEQVLRTLDYKSRLYCQSGQQEYALKIAEELYQKSQEMEMPFFSLDALSDKMMVFLYLGNEKEFNELIKQQEKLFNSIPREESMEFQERVAILLYWKGFSDYLRGNLDICLGYLNKSLALITPVDPSHFSAARNFFLMAYTYAIKGELKLALEYDEKALAIIPEGEYYNLYKGHIYRNLGNIYFQKGDLSKALEYHLFALEMYNKLDEGWWISWSYNGIISISLAQKNNVQAQLYLEQLKQYTEKDKTFINLILYQCARAKMLKISPRMRDRVEAERILTKIVNEDQHINSTEIALVNLCDWYFEEFQISHQMEILNDIQPLINHLQKIAKLQNSYSTLATTKLLQAKLALLQVSMVEARTLLTEAQQIADEHGLQFLAGEISREHDHLLEELKLWESFKKEQASVTDRLKLASINPVMERLQGRRAIEPLESGGQQPVSLLILAAGGVLLFSYPFSDEWKQDDDLFGSFLSAFSTFSDEFFSQGLDRAKFGEDTILLQPVGDFSICYLFKGQTYFAKRKLEKFAETIQKEPAIWDILGKFEKSSQVAEPRDLPQIESILATIFLN